MRQSSTSIITRSGRRSVWILAQCLLILTVLSSSFTMALAEEPASAEDAPDPAALEAIETPTTEPIPVETPEPTPTPEPTVEPTATLEPVPTETPEPTPTLEPEPTAEPAPTETPEPTATPTPSPTPARKPSSSGASTPASGKDFCTFFHDYSGGLTYPLSATFNCKDALAGATVNVSSPTPGWRYEVKISGSTYTEKDKVFPKSFDTLGQMQVLLYPNQGTQGCGQVIVTVTPKGGVTGDSVLVARTKGTDESCVPPDTGQPKPVTASLVGGELPPVTFSFHERRVENAMHILVTNPSHASGWALDVSATELIYAGTVAGQGNWPASSLLVRVGGSTVSLSGASQRIVEIGGDKASYEYPMTLVIPGGSAVGTYTGTVTLTTTAAPGS